MTTFTPTMLAEAVSGRVVSPGPEGVSYSLNTDTRSLAAGQIFVALHGERFDGHDFLAQALSVEGAGLMVEEERLDRVPAEALLSRAVIAVADTTRAYGLAARCVRRRYDVPVVGITGSAGKTTTRELVRCVLASAFGEVLSPRKNFNNHVGVPLTLLGMGPQHKAAVIEMGMSNAGEIAWLATLAQPTVRLITNVGRAHLDTLGDEDGVARAKGELFETARMGDTLIVNLDDERVARLPRPSGTVALTYGRHTDAQVRLVDDPAAPDGAFRVVVEGRALEVELGLPGAHNRLNATSALAVAAALEIDLARAAEALKGAEVEPMRMQVLRLPSGAVVINDAYNANPQSMAVALRTARGMAGADGRVLAALGDMLELGRLAHVSHVELGIEAAAQRVARLFTAGPNGRAVALGAIDAGMDPAGVIVVDDAEELIGPLKAAIAPGDVVLVKGSRGMRMERVVRALLDQGGEA